MLAIDVTRAPPSPQADSGEADASDLVDESRTPSSPQNQRPVTKAHTEHELSEVDAEEQPSGASTEE